MRLDQYFRPFCTPARVAAMTLVVFGSGMPLSAFGQPPVPIKIGQADQTAAACPATFVPARSSNFFSRLTLTLSIGTGF